MARRKKQVESISERIELPAARPAAWWYCALALLVVVVFVVYWPTLANGFVWDDQLNIVENENYRGLGATQLRWAFTTFHLGHYQPLSWLALGVDHAIWGMNPTGYHLTNIILHSINVSLFAYLALVLLRAAFADSAARVSRDALRIGALVAAGVFALHPLRVESVAWVTERRDVLCGVFFMLALLAYLRAVQPPGTLDRRWYLASIACFALSLLSKALGLALPIVLLVLDVYPLRRRSFAGRGGAPTPWARLVLEKVPYLAASLAIGITALLAQQTVGALVKTQGHGFLERAAQVAYGWVFYVWAMFGKLSWYPLYERPYIIDPFEPRFIVAGIMFLSLTAAFVLLRRRMPGLLVSWICYVALLIPVVGVAQSGFQLVADRYSYLACLGWAIMLGAAVVWAWTRSAGAPSQRAVCMTAVVIVLVGWAILSQRQTRIWHDEETLWTHTLEWGPSAMASNNLGATAIEKGDYRAALEHLVAAIESKPTYDLPILNLAAIFQPNFRGFDQQRIQEGIDALATTLRLLPTNGPAYFARGCLILAAAEEHGEPQRVEALLAEADRHFESCIANDPTNAVAWYKRCYLRYSRGDRKGAIPFCHRAVEIDAANFDAWTTLGLLHLESDDCEQAVVFLQRANKLFGQSDLVLGAWGHCLAELGRAAEAIELLERAVSINPNNVRIRTLLQSLRQGATRAGADLVSP